MATRGTYKVEGMLLYNHWDNYPEGTAMQLLEVIKKHGDLSLFSVIRGMEGMLRTGSIYDGPAEFHYVISGKYIECYMIPDGKEKIVPVSRDTIDNWINSQLLGCLEDGDNPDDYRVMEVGNNHYMTISQIKEEATDKFNKAKDYIDRGHIGNGSSLFSEAFLMVNMANIDMPEMKDEYLTKYSPLLTQSYKHNDSEYFDSIAFRKK